LIGALPQRVTPNPQRLINEPVAEDYIALTQRPAYRSEAAWRNESERPGYIKTNKLRFLRPYQLKAVHVLQRAVREGKDRFLFEMATGTGKTLTAAAVIKLFLRSGNAQRALFLVDRLELGEQAKKAFAALLSADFQTVIYKESRDDWRRAEIVVTTVQSLLFNNKYQRLFDFFANCEYFETEFNYDEVLKLPRPQQGLGREDGTGPVGVGGTYEHLGGDIIASLRVEEITHEGMKIDRMFFERFEDNIRENPEIVAAIEAGQWDQVIDYVNREVFDKPEEFYTLDKLRKAAAVDRRLTLRKILEKVFGLIPRFRSRDELLEEEFAKFVADRKPEEAAAIPAIKTFFKAYATSGRVRDIIDSRQFTDLATNPMFSTRDFKAVPPKYRALVPDYIKDYVSLNQFAALKGITCSTPTPNAASTPPATSSSARCPTPRARSSRSPSR